MQKTVSSPAVDAAAKPALVRVAKRASTDAAVARLVKGRVSVSGVADADGLKRRPKNSVKGQQTKAAIVDAALGLATQIGLEGLSIGALAEVMRMSKSGVFAHFGSREELQVSVVREYHARFEEEVFYPALEHPRGLARVQALFDNWMQRTAVEIDQGCLYISGAIEFEDRTGPVREALASSVQTWLAAMNRAVAYAKATGEIDEAVDEQQVTFEIHGLILTLHYQARFLKAGDAMTRAKLGFASMLQRYTAH
jgi:AcrR family transcriptional regulator